MPKKILLGTIVSNTMPNTATVVVERKKVHPLYHKQYRVTKKYRADTAGKSYEIGEKVLIEETRPMSKMKSWKVVEKMTNSQITNVQ